MPLIITKAPLIFGLIPEEERPKLPEGFTATYSRAWFAFATAPDGKEYFIGEDRLTLKRRSVPFGDYMDESETIPLK